MRVPVAGGGAWRPRPAPSGSRTLVLALAVAVLLFGSSVLMIAVATPKGHAASDIAAPLAPSVDGSSPALDPLGDLLSSGGSGDDSGGTSLRRRPRGGKARGAGGGAGRRPAVDAWGDDAGDVEGGRVDAEPAADDALDAWADGSAGSAKQLGAAVSAASDAGASRRLLEAKEAELAAAQAELASLRAELEAAKAAAEDARAAAAEAVVAGEKLEGASVPGGGDAPPPLPACPTPPSPPRCPAAPPAALAPPAGAGDSAPPIGRPRPKSCMPNSNGRTLLAAWRARQVDWHDLVAPARRQSDSEAAGDARYRALVQSELDTISYLQGFLAFRGGPGRSTSGGAPDPFDVSRWYAPQGDWGPMAKYGVRWREGGLGGGAGAQWCV